MGWPWARCVLGTEEGSRGPTSIRPPPCDAAPLNSPGLQGHADPLEWRPPGRAAAGHAADHQPLTAQLHARVGQERGLPALGPHCELLSTWAGARVLKPDLDRPTFLPRSAPARMRTSPPRGPPLRPWRCALSSTPCGVSAAATSVQPLSFLLHICPPCTLQEWLYYGIIIVLDGLWGRPTQDARVAYGFKARGFILDPLFASP